MFLVSTGWERVRKTMALHLLLPQKRSIHLPSLLCSSRVKQQLSPSQSKGRFWGWIFKGAPSATERNAAVTAYSTLFSWQQTPSSPPYPTLLKPRLIFWGNHHYIAIIPSQGKEQAVKTPFFKANRVNFSGSNILGLGWGLPLALKAFLDCMRETIYVSAVLSVPTGNTERLPQPAEITPLASSAVFFRYSYQSTFQK